MNTAKLIAVFCVFSLTAGCLAKRSFQNPKERPTTGTAYSLTHGEIATGLELFGQENENLGVRAGFAVGFGKDAQVGINVAHAVLGMVNLQGKYKFIEKKWWAMSAGLGFIWLYPPALWAAPSQLTKPLGDAHIFSIPVDATSSFALADWLGVHLKLGYVHSELAGEIGSDSAAFDGSIGTRQIHVSPLVTILIAERVNLFVGGRIRVWGILTEEVVGEREREEGFITGVRSAEWRDLDLRRGSHGTVGAELKFGATTYVVAYLMLNGALSRTELVGSPVLPGVRVFWRF